MDITPLLDHDPDDGVVAVSLPSDDGECPPSLSSDDEECPCRSVAKDKDCSSSLTSSTGSVDTASLDPKRLTVVIPMYREVAEAKTALRSCFDLHSYGYGKDLAVDILVVIDGCTADNDLTLQAVELELLGTGGSLGEPRCNADFGCLQYRATYGTMTLEVLVKGCRVRKGKRFSHILAFDFLSARGCLAPDVVILQDCDTYFPPAQVDAAVDRALNGRKIVCPMICISGNVFHDGLFPVFKGSSETILRYWRNAMQRIGCCPLIPGPIAVYPFGALQKLMALYAQEVPHEDNPFFGNKMLVEDSYMGWCATAAGLAPAIEFNACHGYWRLPERLYPLLRQRRRWRAGQISTGIIGHPNLDIAAWRVFIMQTCDLWINIMSEVYTHCFMTLLVHGLALQFFGDFYVLVFLSPLLRSLLCRCINEKNDGFFLVWGVADSLLPFVLLPWTYTDIGIAMNQPVCAVSALFTLTIVAMYAIKNGVGTAAQVLLTYSLYVAVYELQIYELEYACWCFEDIAWGNREVASKLPATKLEIPCNTVSTDKAWAGASSSVYKKTCGSTMMTLIPLFYRLVLIAVLWSEVVSLPLCLYFLMLAPFISSTVTLCELFVTGKSRPERSYEAGSSLSLPGPILKHVDVQMCKQV